MAKKDKPVFHYNLELKRLQEHGPERLYFLSGPEDYLRECFLSELQKACGVSGDDFGCCRLDGPVIDLNELAGAVDALPFFTERSLIEVRDFDAAKCRDADCDRLKSIISDIPEYCTVVFLFSAADPDGRTSAVKALKKAAYTIEFTEQEQGALTRWVQNRFLSIGKKISSADAQYLIFLSGTRMSGLIPEIDKIAGYAAEEQVSRGDIDATANRIPEADVFAMTDMVSRRQFDSAAALLSDLLSDKNNHPIQINALLGQQYRKMYAVKAGQNAGRSRSDIMELCGVTFGFIFDKLSASVKPYTEQQLGTAVSLCAEYDYRMKSTGLDPYLLLRELFARIVAGL